MRIVIPTSRACRLPYWCRRCLQIRISISVRRSGDWLTEGQTSGLLLEPCDCGSISPTECVNWKAWWRSDMSSTVAWAVWHRVACIHWREGEVTPRCSLDGGGYSLIKHETLQENSLSRGIQAERIRVIMPIHWDQWKYRQKRMLLAVQVGVIFSLLPDVAPDGQAIVLFG